MGVIQLDLFGQSMGADCAPAQIIEMIPARRPSGPAAAKVRPAICEYSQPALRAGFDSSIVSPCAQCPLKGLCDSDDCAMYLFDLDCDECEINYIY